MRPALVFATVMDHCVTVGDLASVVRVWKRWWEQSGEGRAGACVKKAISMSSALTSTSKHTSDVASWSTDVVEPEKTLGKSPFFDLTKPCTVC